MMEGGAGRSSASSPKPCSSTSTRALLDQLEGFAITEDHDTVNTNSIGVNGDERDIGGNSASNASEVSAVSGESQHPLLKEAVLRKIFTYFSGQEPLLHFRLVCKTWRDVLRSIATPKIIYFKRNRTYSMNDEERTPLGDFLEFWEDQCQTTPFRQVHLKHWRFAERKMGHVTAISRFWNVVGSHLTKLTLERCSSALSRDFLRRITRSCPNLETLVLQDCSFRGLGIRNNIERNCDPDYRKPAQGEHRNLKCLHIICTGATSRVSTSLRVTYMELLSHFPCLTSVHISTDMLPNELLYFLRAVKKIRMQDAGKLPITLLATGCPARLEFMDEEPEGQPATHEDYWNWEEEDYSDWEYDNYSDYWDNGYYWDYAECDYYSRMNYYDTYLAREFAKKLRAPNWPSENDEMIKLIRELHIPLQSIELNRRSTVFEIQDLVETSATGLATLIALDYHAWTLDQITYRKEWVPRRCSFPFGVNLENLQVLFMAEGFCESLEFLKSTPNLATLCVYNPEYIPYKFRTRPRETVLVSNTQIAEMINVKLLKLTVLQMECIVGEEDLRCLAQWMPHVTKLQMTLNDSQFAIVCENWTNLKELQVLGRDLTDAGVTGKKSQPLQPNITCLQRLEVFTALVAPLTGVSVFRGFLKLSSLRQIYFPRLRKANDKAKDALLEKGFKISVRNGVFKATVRRADRRE